MSDSMSDNGADISESDVSTGTDSAASEPEALDWHRMFLPVLVAVCGICLTAAAAFMSLRSEYDICQGENCANDGKMYLAKTGDAERANEYYLRAEQYYMRALEFSPIWRQSLIYRFLGNLVKDMYADVSGMKDRALFNSSLECFDCAVSFDSSDPFNYSNKAELLRLDPERLNDALEAIDAALRIDPRNPQYCYQKARILLELHRYTEARDLSMNGLTYCPNAPYLWDTLARAHRHTGEYGLAERDLENLVKLEPKAEGNAAQIRTIMKAE